MKDMTVKGVDDDGNTRQPSRDAPDEARFGSVGVNHVGLQAANEAVKRPDGDQVAEWVE